MKKPRKWTREEDTLLRSLAGVKSAAEISTIIGRPKDGIHHRIKKLGLNGRLTGEHHWNAIIDNLTASILLTLHDSGFKPKEIHEVFSKFNLSHRQVCELLNRRKV